MRGRKPTPTVLLKLKGTFRPGRHGRSRVGEPVAKAPLPLEPPEWLTAPQRADWLYAVEHAPANVLKAVDRQMLTVWVEAVDTHRTAMIAQSRLDAGSSMPLMTKGKNGDVVVSPYVGIARRASIAIINAAGDLGFSPASRPRLAAGVQAILPDPQSPWARLKVLQGGKGDDDDEPPSAA